MKVFLKLLSFTPPIVFLIERSIVGPHQPDSAWALSHPKACLLILKTIQQEEETKNNKKCTQSNVCRIKLRIYKSVKN